MNKLQHISDFRERELPILSEEEAGELYSKWSFVNVYSLQDLRDVYMITKKNSIKDIKSLTQKINTSLNVSEEWEERKTLEYINALVKFGLLDAKYNSTTEYFLDAKINSELSENDINTLKSIFFSYFRFKELSSWFIDTKPEIHNQFNALTESDFINKSCPLYYYCERNRFTDTIITSIENDNFRYKIENKALMRFWDVYLKWGTTLNILDKFNLAQIGLNIDLNKEISIVYFIKKFVSFGLLDFIKDQFGEKRHIWIPELIFKIVQNYRFSIHDIKSFIVSEIQTNEKLTFERTSEIFLIKGKNSKKNIDIATYLFPQINDSYVSNLIIRK